MQYLLSIIRRGRILSARLPFKKRSREPTSLVKKTFQAAALEIASRFLKSDSFQHAATKGSEREKPVQEFFRENLPGKYEVAKGEVFDLSEKHSPQLDVMIFDGQENFAFYSEENCIIPAEALLASIEVKSLLDKKELKLALKSASKLRELRPLRMELASPRKKGEFAGKKYRYFHCLFAYDTDIAEDKWLSNEYARLVTVSESLRVPRSTLDRLYVANHGLIDPCAKRGIPEEPRSGRALMNFYMHILNFLLRENRRRKPAPYIDYAGRLTEGWIRLE